MKLSEQIAGEWVIVIYEYDGRPYPGCVSGYSKETDEVVVSVIRQRGCNQFIWPVPKDISYPVSSACPHS